MAVAVGDIVQLTDAQQFLGQTVLNVYFYRVMTAGASTTLQTIAQAFEGTVVTPMLNIQSSALTHSLVVARNLTDGIDIFEEPQNRPGVVSAGESLASFYALSFRLVRTNASTRHGSKRIGGLTEDVVNGNSLNSSFVAAVNLLATAMAADLESTGVGVAFTAEPVIVGRIHKGNPNVGDIDLDVINPVSSAAFIRVSTQTTRRAGRGV